MRVSMTHGMLDGNIVIYAPYPLRTADAVIYTNSDEIHLKNGYKRIVKTACPSKEGFYYTQTLSQNKTEIIQGWKEHVVEVDDSPTLEDCKYALTVLGISEFDTKESLASSVARRVHDFYR